jgi:hypothetical protein
MIGPTDEVTFPEAHLTLPAVQVIGHVARVIATNAEATGLSAQATLGVAEANGQRDELTIPRE